MFVKLVHDWFVLPDFSHGILIPFFVAYVLWRQRHSLQQEIGRPSWLGLVLLLPGLMLLLLGVLGAELYLARISVIFVTSGALWLLAGRSLVLRLMFPLAVLLLAIPIPQVIFYQLTAPLQHLAATIATALLPLCRVPVLQQGNIIHLPSLSLEVAEACSGIRSLLSLCTLAVLFGYFAEKNTGRRWLLVACSVPIAVVANALRIVGTGVLVQYRGAAVALGFFHEFSGVLIFTVSVLMLMGIHVLSNRALART